MSELQKIRIDKWLWAVRLYKTRTLATEACAAGKVKIDSESVKPSYLLKVGQLIHINRQGEKWIIKSLKLIERGITFVNTATIQNQETQTYFVDVETQR